MCFHKSLLSKHDELMQHYAASFDSITEEPELVRYHENGFDFKNTPVVTAGRPDAFQFFSWGLIPHWVKDEASGKKLRVQTLNCISEEMYDKPSFRDAAINNQRCLVPCSGFYEWRWGDEKGKTKIPYYIGLKDQSLFSLAGIYARWKNTETGQYQFTYSVLTTVANPLMATIHNSKKRMPVIIPKEYEKDWLNKNLTREDVLAFCAPIDENAMRAFTISKRITSRTEDTNVPEVLVPHEWLEGSPDKQGSLF
jgi:putative SOS response-associated peptidase YedK